MEVEAVYAEPGRQLCQRLALHDGATVEEALAVLAECEGFSAVSFANVGVWGEISALDRVLVPGDRLEIYRPLETDPKTARHRRAEQHKAVKQARVGQGGQRGGGRGAADGEV